MAPAGADAKGGADRGAAMAPAGAAAPAMAPAGADANGAHPVERDSARTAVLRQRLLDTRAVLAAYLKGNDNSRPAVVKELEADITEARRELDDSKPIADLYNLQKKLLKQHEASHAKADEEATWRWAQVPKAVDFAKEGDALRKEALQALEDSRARFAELAQADGQPAPPTAIQGAQAIAESVLKQVSALPAHHAAAIGGVSDLLASLQAKLSEAAASDTQPDPQPGSEGDAAMGNPLHAANDAHGGAAPAVPSVATEPSRADAPTLVPSADAVVGTPAAATPPLQTADSQQGADISATQEDTDLVAQANALCQAVQYDPAPLAEARAALGARLAFPPLDFDCIRRDIQKVQDAITGQAEAEDLQPQAKLQRQGTTESPQATDDL